MITKSIAVPSGAPLNVRTDSVTSRSVRVSWEPPLADQQNGPILHYLLVVLAQQNRTTFTLNATSTSVTIPDLHPSYSYSIEVAAVTVGTGPFSSPLTVTTANDGESNPDHSRPNLILCV